MVKCLSKDRNGDQCRNNGLDDTRFCKFHQYMNEYTDDMLAHLELCKGCKKQYYFEDGEKTCTNCANRGKENKMKEKAAVVLCEKEGCKFKKSDENKYCGKHQLCIFEDETREAGKKLCFNYIRGCRTQLDMSYAYSRCEECLEKDRKKDKERRTTIKTIIVETNGLTNELRTTKYCNTCLKEFPLESFNGEKNNITKTCKTCRDDNKKQDLKRDKEHRNELARNNLKPQYTTYKKGAKDRNLEFNISYDEYEALVKLPCHYCGIIQERGFNGIDRRNSSIGYIIENSVSCCPMCNYMKGPLTESIFLNRVEHILTHQKRIEGNLYPSCFIDHKKSTYKQYEFRAEKSNFEFSITYEDYIHVTNSPCYICGKINTDTNENGIDRYDNKKGYISENIRPCCGECNYMKIDYDFNDVIEKLMLIYKKQEGIIYESPVHNVRNFRFT